MKNLPEDHYICNVTYFFQVKTGATKHSSSLLATKSSSRQFALSMSFIATPGTIASGSTLWVVR
jgi:hypothetical protein